MPTDDEMGHSDSEQASLQICVGLSFSCIVINPRTFSLIQNMLVEHRQASMLSEHFIRSENNLT